MTSVSPAHRVSFDLVSCTVFIPAPQHRGISSLALDTPDTPTTSTSSRTFALGQSTASRPKPCVCRLAPFTTNLFRLTPVCHSLLASMVQR